MAELSKLNKADTNVTQGDYLVGVRINGNGSASDVLFNSDQLPQAQVGSQGIQGEQGIQGLQGIQGEKGDTGDIGATGASGITGLNWRGAWSAIASNYILNDVVSDNGASYFCILNGSTVPAPHLNPTYWALLAAQGATGANGAQGIQGAQGAQGISGPQGPQGPQGTKGDKGDTGNIGATGAIGSAGTNGTNGTNENPHSNILNVVNSGYSAISINVSSGLTGSNFAVNDVFAVGNGTGIGPTCKVTGVSAGHVTSILILHGGNNCVVANNNTCYTSTGTGSGLKVDITAITGAAGYGFYDGTSFTFTQYSEGRQIKQIRKDQKTYLLGLDFTQYEDLIQGVTFTFTNGDKLILWT